MRDREQALWGNWTAYLYDAEGNRVAKGSMYNPPAGKECDFTANGFTIADEYLPGPDGQMLTHFAQQDYDSNTNISAEGTHVATYNYGRVYFQANDWLGTKRIVTDYTGSPVIQYRNSPFGDLQAFYIYQDWAGDYSQDFFTGKERDYESGLDNFGARYYGSPAGRYISPDFGESDESIPFANFADPQSLNAYAYVRGNPFSRFDADGHKDCGNKKDPCPHTSDQVTVTAELDDVFDTLRSNIVSVVQRTQEYAANFVSTARDIIGGQKDAGCMASTTSIGASFGMMGGAALGSPSVATGPGVAVGEPLAIMAGGSLGGSVGRLVGMVSCRTGGNGSGGSSSGEGGTSDSSRPPVKATKLKGNQGWRDENGNIWKKDMLHKDHWDISDRTGNKIREVTFDGRELWPNGPKNAR